jgi:hypothetical protein
LNGNSFIFIITHQGVRGSGELALFFGARLDPPIFRRVLSRALGIENKEVRYELTAKKTTNSPTTNF